MFHIIWAIIFIIKLYKSVANAPNVKYVAYAKHETIITVIIIYDYFYDQIYDVLKLIYLFDE